MKKVSFLVAFLAFLQIASGARIFAQERLPENTRRNVEEALELANEDIAQELEELIQQLELSAQQMGQDLERWAEDNSQELEAWSEKYAKQWEAWGDRFEKKMERLSADQENAWGDWAQGYKKDLDRWANEIESNEFAPKEIGEFVERNLKTLSKMPLGQMVDQALEEGLGELSEAPWESLEELGDLAKGAFEKLDDSVSQKISDLNDRATGRSQENSRVGALRKLRERDGISRQQKERIDGLIKTIEDTSRLEKTERRIDVPRKDQLKARLEREKQRRIEELKKFDQGARRLKDESHKETIRKSDQKSKQLDARLPKRADGKNIGRSLKKPTSSRQDSFQKIQRDGRDGKANRKPAAETSRNQSAKSDGNAKSEVELLREQLARLRREIQQLKKESDK